jgi:hypothetical protein
MKTVCQKTGSGHNGAGDAQRQEYRQDSGHAFVGDQPPGQRLEPGDQFPDAANGVGEPFRIAENEVE